MNEARALVARACVLKRMDIHSTPHDDVLVCAVLVESKLRPGAWV